MPRRALSISLLVLGAASAQAARIVPMAPTVKPAPSPELRDRLHEAVAKGLGKEQEVMPPAEVRERLYAAPDLLDCAVAACMARVAQVLHADRLVTAEIEQVGKTYRYRLRVFDAQGNEVGKAAEDACEICSVREAGEALEKTAAKLQPSLIVAPPEPTPEVKPPRRDPPEARTAPEPVPAPRAKPTDPLAPRTEAARVDPAPKAEAPRQVERVERLPPREEDPGVEPPAKPPRPQPVAQERKAEQPKAPPYRPLAYGAFAVAGAALVATITFSVFAAREGSVTCGTGDKTSCPTIYKGNVAPAAVFGVLTALAAGAGGLLLYLDSRERKSRRPTVGAAISPEGAAVAASWEF